MVVRAAGAPLWARWRGRWRPGGPRRWRMPGFYRGRMPLGTSLACRRCHGRAVPVTARRVHAPVVLEAQGARRGPPPGALGAVGRGGGIRLLHLPWRRGRGRGSGRRWDGRDGRRPLRRCSGGGWRRGGRRWREARDFPKITLACSLAPRSNRRFVYTNRSTNAGIAPPPPSQFQRQRQGLLLLSAHLPTVAVQRHRHVGRAGAGSEERRARWRNARLSGQL